MKKKTEELINKPASEKYTLDALGEIMSKSKNIKANMRIKYHLCKLQKTCETKN